MTWGLDHLQADRDKSKLFLVLAFGGLFETSDAFRSLIHAHVGSAQRTDWFSMGFLAGFLALEGQNSGFIRLRALLIFRGFWR